MQPIAFKDSRSLLIVLFPFFGKVSFPVYLDDEIQISAIEIYDAVVDWTLTHKAGLELSEIIEPQSALGLGHVFS